MRRDIQIDYYVALPKISFDGDVIIDAYGKELSDFNIVALSGTFDDLYTGEFADYLTGGVWFEQFVKALMENEMFLARVQEEIDPPVDPDYLRDAAHERERLFRVFPD